MRLKLEENESIRTITIRVKNKKERKKLTEQVYRHKHFENMLLILIKQNYDLFTEKKETNDFKYLSNYEVMRAVIRNTNGGKHEEKVKYIKEKYQKNQLMQELIKHGRELKIHNLSMLMNEIKSNYKSFFTKIKKGDESAKPPKPKKLAKLNKFSIELDFNSWSFKKKNRVGINLSSKMFYLYLKHDEITPLVGDLENIQSVLIHFSNEDIYLKISYRYEMKKEICNKEKYAGMDIGVNNLSALFIHDSDTPSLIICGKRYKHYNATFNRMLAKINQTIAKLTNIEDKNLKQEKKIISLKSFRSYLHEKRHRYFYDQFHKMSTRLLEYCKKNGVSDIFVSKNLANLKNNGQSKMSKTNNQNFIQIPMIKFIEYLEYKGVDYSVAVHNIDESYTSKTSCLSGNVIKIQEKAKKGKPILTNDFNGSRVKRGLFHDKKLSLRINADLNASVNHIKIGSGKNIKLRCLKKICNPIKIKSDRELFCLLAN